MSITIPGMEMPENCDACVFFKNRYLCQRLNLSVYVQPSFSPEENRFCLCPLISSVRGYSLDELVEFADQCRIAGVDKNDLKVFSENLDCVLDRIAGNLTAVFNGRNEI